MLATPWVSRRTNSIRSEAIRYGFKCTRTWFVEFREQFFLESFSSRFHEEVHNGLGHEIRESFPVGVDDERVVYYLTIWKYETMRDFTSSTSTSARSMMRLGVSMGVVLIVGGWSTWFFILNGDGMAVCCRG